MTEWDDQIARCQRCSEREYCWYHMQRALLSVHDAFTELSEPMPPLFFQRFHEAVKELEQAGVLKRA